MNALKRIRKLSKQFFGIAVTVIMTPPGVGQSERESERRFSALLAVQVENNSAWQKPNIQSLDH